MKSVRLFLVLCLATFAGPRWARAQDPIVCVPGSQFQPPPLAPAPAPRDAGLPRLVYEGATPQSYDPGRPVIVFVQGLHGEARDWWDPTEYHGRNDMYDNAHAAGYKTFFVDLGDAGGEGQTAIVNGRLLKAQLEWIADYWTTDRFNIIAHSKGGVDSNTAALMGAPIDSIVTLGSPHWGSPLADLAQSSWFEWLADILGYNDAGTKFLQTGCMSLFRDVADGRPENDALSVYTAAGTSWGPLFSSLWFGGSYLSSVCPPGSNDGLVCVEHANHPLSRDTAGEPTGSLRLLWDGGGNHELDHDHIRKGNAFLEAFWWWQESCWVPVFDSVEPYAGAFHSMSSPSTFSAPRPSTRLGPSRPARQILRGGPVASGRTVATFPIEYGARRFAAHFLFGRESTRASLRDPAGRVYPLPVAQPWENEIFRGAFSSATLIREPLPGVWTVVVSSPDESAYGLVVTFDSDLPLRLRQPATGSVSTDGSLSLRLESPLAALSAVAHIRRTSTGGEPVLLGERTLSGAGMHVLRLGRPGVYNVSVTLRGTTASGSAFERNHVFSLGVKDPFRPTALPAVCR